MHYPSTNKQIESDKRITTEALIEYIKTNIDKIQSLDFVDLNFNSYTEVKELKKLSIQDVRPVLFLPEVLNEFFDLNETKLLHAGVLEKIPKYQDKNISLFSSVIVCLKQSFLSQSVVSQQKDITTFIDCLKNDSSKFNYRKKYGWEKDDLSNCIENGFIGSNIIKYLSDYLCINIFILNIESDQGVMFGGGDEYIPYKKNIFLLHYGSNSFEPLYSESGIKYFMFDDPVIKKIRSNKNKIKVYKLHEGMKTNFIECEENLDVYLYNEKNKEVIEKRKEEKTCAQVDETNIEEVLKSLDKEPKSDTKTYTLKDLKVLKLTELKDIANSFKIDLKIGGKNKTKDQLISDIIKKN
jgi:hypothetical protein